MDAHPRLDENDWASIRKAGDVTLLQAAVECGLKGDVASLTCLMRHFKHAGLTPIAESTSSFATFVYATPDDDPNQNRHQRAATPKADDLGVRKETGAVSIAQAVGLALSREPRDGVLNDILEVDIKRTERDGNAPNRLVPWRAIDEELIQAAISAMGSVGSLTPRAWHLFQSIIRTTDQPEALDAFKRAGCLSGEIEYLLLPSSRVGQSRWQNESLIDWMLTTGRVRNLDWILGRLDKGQANQPTLKLAQDAGRITLFSDRTRASINRAMVEETKALVSANLGPCQLTERPVVSAAIRVLQHFVKLDKRVGDQHAFEKEAIHLLADHLTSLAGRGLRCDPKVLDAFMNLNLAGERTVGHSLASWDLRSKGSWTLTTEPEFELIESAVRYHYPTILAAAAPMLSRMNARGSEDLRIRLQHGWPWVASDFKNKAYPFDIKLWTSTLKAMKECGLDVNDGFQAAGEHPKTHKKEFKKTSILHLLAESNHPHCIEAMIGCLDEGLSSAVKDNRGWTPSRAIKDPDLKLRWTSAEKSRAAQRAAQEALLGFAVCEEKTETTGFNEAVGGSRQKGVP